MWNPLEKIVSKIDSAGGFVNAHAHFDRAYSVSEEDFLSAEVNSHLFEKWKLVDKFKGESSEDRYFAHMEKVLRDQARQGVKCALSFIDSDPIAGDRAIKAAVRAKAFAKNELNLDFYIACQTLKGVIASEARDYFEQALPHVDIIGGLPGADKGREEEHLDILLSRGKALNKRVHVHVDQLNSAEEKETELLARKVIQHGMQGNVTAVHGISIAAHKKSYRKEVYAMCRDAGLSFVACPTAWIDSRRTEVLSPTHNALTPLDEMIPEGITVALGTDNICDLYKPFADGNLLTELRVLLEGTHFYGMEELIQVATVNGRKVIGV